MIRDFRDAPERLTDGSTFYWSRAFPTVWATVVGSVVILGWMGVLGGALEPVELKAGITAAWATGSLIFFRMFAGLKEVWLDGDDLLVGDPTRGTRISLRDVRAVRESRLRQVKSITLQLARPTPLGTSITFVPRGLTTFLFPWASSPVAAQLRERRRRLPPPE